jgi:hypothetical protein
VNSFTVDMLSTAKMKREVNEFGLHFGHARSTSQTNFP